MANHSIIVGIVGQPSAGKDVAAAYFVSRGWKHISTGDILRDEMRARGIPIDRPHMHDFAIAMRKEHGMDYPASEAGKQAGQLIESGQNAPAGIVISGLRNVAEATKLKATFGKQFILMAIHVPIEMRYERARLRNRIGDHISFEQFKQQEDAERASGENAMKHADKDNWGAVAGAYSLDAVIAMTDLTLENAGTQQDFYAKLDGFLAEHRPSANL